MTPRLLLLLTLLAVLSGAAWRWRHLESRPLHADEAVQAWQTWQLLRGEGYRYDPVDRHGPWLYYGAAAVERLRGGSAATFDDARARTFAWLAGVATLALVAFLAWRHLGPIAAAVATALLAVAPLAVLYHTYFVQEVWLALFTWALFLVLLQWSTRPSVAGAAVAGTLAGLMQVTKETSVLHFAALGIAFLPLLRTAHPGDATAPERRPGRAAARHLLVALGCALVVYAAFYSGFGRHPAGLVDGVMTYVHQWRRSGDDAHAHPFFHYLALLAPHRAGGVRWGEPLLLLLAAAGALWALRRAAPPAPRAIAWFTLLLLLIYSAIPYKTPWLLLTPVTGLALLAAHAVGELARFRRWGAVLAALLAVATVAQLAQRTRLALDRYPGDERNPYFYQQTPRSFAALDRRLAELAAFRPTTAVVSPDHAWPLPWYRRGQERVGYFATVPDSLEGFDLLVWDTRIEPPDAWPDGAVVELHGLRPNVLLQLVIEPALWARWQEAHLPPETTRP